MTLRKKTLIVIGVTTVCLIMIPYFILRGILRESVEKLEGKSTRQDVERALTAIDSGLKDMDTLTYDWATWDDTYAFVAEPNEAYIQNNLPDTSFKGLKLDMMLFTDASDTVVFGKTCDESRQRVFDIPEAILKEILINKMIIHHEEIDSHKAGIVMLAEGPLMFCSRPVVTSNNEGPIHGTVLFGRYLRKHEIGVLEERTHLSLSIFKLDDPQMPSDCQAAVSSLKETVIFVRPLSQQKIAGYTIVNDFYGKPALMMRVDVPREIYQQGKANIAQFILYFLPVGLVFGVVILFIIEKIVVSRLSRLSRNVSAIGASGDLSARLEVAGKDEVANVAGEVNKMLETLEQSDAALKTSKELKRAKEAAEHATAKLRVEKTFSENIIETANSIIKTLDREGRIMTFNRRASEMTGYSRDEVMGREWFDLFVPEPEREGARSAFREYLSGKYADNTHENHIICKNGQERLVQWENSVLKDEKDAIIGTLSIGNDVTRQRQAEEALRQSEERYRSVIDNIGIGVSLISPKMEILALNKQMRDWNPAVDASQKPICYKAFNNPPREDVCSYCPTHKTLQDGQIHESITATPTNGGIRNYRVVSSPITGQDGKIVAAIEMVDDVTERLQKDEALRESQHRLEAILNTIPDIVWLKDREGKYVAANEAMGRTAGTPPAGMVGKTDMSFWPEDLARHYMADDSEVIATGKRKLIEEPLVSADGSRTWIETIKTPVFGENGEVIGTTGIARDVTERKRTEDEIREARDKAEAISRELAAKMGELELFNRLAVGREMMMIELKQKINGLCEKYGEKPPYDLSAVATGQAENGTENGDAAETAGTKEK